MLVEDFFVWAKEEFDTEMTLMRDKGKEYTSVSQSLQQWYTY